MRPDAEQHRQWYQHSQFLLRVAAVFAWSFPLTIFLTWPPRKFCFIEAGCHDHDFDTMAISLGLQFLVAASLALFGEFERRISVAQMYGHAEAQG